MLSCWPVSSAAAMACEYAALPRPAAAFAAPSLLTDPT
jgi:hypothetical protein